MVRQLVKRSAVFVAMFVALAAAGSAASSPPGPPADQATAYQSDPTHDGYMADADLAAPLTQAWSITLPHTVSYPLIVAGTVFVTTGDTLYALNQATGSTIWSHAIGGSTGIAYDGGKVFVVGQGGLLTAFDAASGSIAWSEQLPGQYSFSAPATATNGIVYISGAGSGGTVYAVRESDGHLLWTGSVENGDASSPAVNSQGVYVSYACQQAYDFNPVSGNLLWHHSTYCEGGGGATTVVASGTVFARDWAIGNIMLSASTGSELGPFSAGPPPAVANDVAYMVSGHTPGATLTAIAGAGLGTIDWTFGSDGFVDTAPLVVGGLVFVGSSTDNLYALDATTGATSWSTNLGAAPTDLAAANGTLIVSAGTTLMAYRTAGAITTAPSNESPPSVDGSANVNESQAVDVGVWSGLPDSYSYQWELCDAGGANCADIDGATGSTFIPPGGDLGLTLRVKVVATNGVGSSTPVESAASAVLGQRPGTATSISLSPSEQSISPGDQATLTAQVTGRSDGTVALYGAPTGGSKSLLTFGEVGEGGGVTFEVSPSVTTTYSAVLEAGNGYASSTSEDATVTVTPYSMPIAVSRHTVTYGQKIQLKVTGVATAGQVDLFATSDGQAQTLLKTVYAADGQDSVSFTVEPKLRTTYVVERDDHTASSRNLTVSVRPRLAVTVHTQLVSPAEIRRHGEKVSIEAMRKPALPDEPVGLVVERSRHGHWETVAHGEFLVGSSGSAVVVFRAKVPGRYRARASYTADGDYASAQSHWRGFQVG